MTQKTKTSIRLLFWGLLALNLIIVLAGLLGFIAPDVRAWRLERSQRSIVREARLETEKALMHFEESAASTQEHRQLASRLDAVFPETIDLPQIYDEVSDIVSRSGLALSGIDVASVAAEDTTEVGRAQVTLRVAGFTYPTLRRMIELIEQAPRLYDLRSVVFSGEAPNATITLWTYAFAPISQP